LQCTAISVAEVSTRFQVTLLFFYYVSLRYFWRLTGRLAGTRREFDANAVLAAGLFGFNPHRRANGLLWNITTTVIKE